MEGRLGRFIDRVRGKKSISQDLKDRFPGTEVLYFPPVKDEKPEKEGLKKILRDPDGEDLYLRKGIYPPTH